MKNLKFVVVTEKSNPGEFTILKDDCALSDNALVFIYALNGDEPSAKVGCIYRNGRCSVVGLNRDCYCTIDDMIGYISESV